MTALYVSPQGSGDHSGSNWNNAAQITSLNTLIKKAGAGGQILLKADEGSYTVNHEIAITAGGTAGHPVVIRGVDSSGHDMQATIIGDRPSKVAASNPSGNELFKMLDGADNLKFTQLDIRNSGTAFRAGADISHITIDHVDATNVGRFFEDWKSGSEISASVSKLTIRDVNIEGFSNEAIRLQYDTNGVKIQNVHADAAGQIGDPYIEGVHLQGTVHDVLIQKTSMDNATTKGVRGSYWNGDGFATEAGVHAVRFEETSASGNTDGGYDLKSSETVLVRATADGNGRNYRFWGDAELIDSAGFNPMHRGGTSSQNQVWIGKDADVLIKNSTFKDSSSSTVVFAGSGGSISFDDVDATHSGTGELTGFWRSHVANLDEVTEHFVYSAHSTTDLALWSL